MVLKSPLERDRSAGIPRKPTADIPSSNVEDALAYLKANAGVQPGDLATVATTGDYDDLTNKPTLGSAAAEDTTAFATAAQGALADSAIQSADLAAVATSGAYSDLTGAPTLGTAAALDVDTDGTLTANSDSRVPSQKAVKTAIAAGVASIVDSSPATLDTLNELAAALGDDPNFATTVSTAIGLKLAKANNLSDLANAATARENLGLEIGTDVQAYSARLAAIAALSPSEGDAIVWNGTEWEASEVATSGREVLTADRTYYVRSDGSNSNDGLSNTSGGAFLTLQKAYNVIAGNLDLAGFAVTVQIADGTYTGGLSVSQPWTGGGSVTFQGNSGTPANVVISTTSADCYAVSIPLPGILTIKDQKLQTTTSGHCISHGGWGVIQYGNIVFGACVGGHLTTLAAGKIIAISNYSVAGNAANHFGATSGGNIVSSGATITLTGTPAFSTAFAAASSGGGIDASNTTFSGSATGLRYRTVIGGWIYTASGGASFFPGSSSGTGGTTTGGGYYL